MITEAEKNIIRKHAEKYRVKEVYLFGSLIRREIWLLLVAIALIDDRCTSGRLVQPDHVSVTDLFLRQDSLFVSFSSGMQAYGGGSCRVGQILSSLNRTIDQFQSIHYRDYSIDGTKDV